VTFAAPGTGVEGVLAATAGSVLCVALLLASVVSTDERERALALTQALRRRALGGSRRPQETVG
jgi:hypothetical protein